MNPSSAPVAEISGVSLQYGKTRALDDLSLSLPARCIVGLIGPDGVGKSSLLALIAGARKLQQGHVQVLDGDMGDAGHRRAVCPRIAYMPQGLGKNLYPTLTVFENLEFFGRLFGQDAAERRWRIAELTRSTGLAPFVERPAGKLSGGMKQKLGLCCALIHDPDLLILDEPTRGIDVGAKYEIYAIINELAAQGKGVIVISSELPELLGISDRIYTVFEGRVTDCIPADQATPEDLMRSMTSATQKASA